MLKPPEVWSRGDVIAVQDVWQGRIWAVRSMIVVDDGPDGLALWIPRGTLRKVPVGIAPAGNRGEELAYLLSTGSWSLEDRVWDISSLMLVRPGDWYSVLVSFVETGAHLDWYLNFQEPCVRTSLGIQTMDLALDIVVEADRRTWRWKDEDEFRLFQDRGLIRPDAARKVLDSAASLVSRIAGGSPPFDDAWVSWRPEAEWGVPALPAGWDVV